MIKEFINIGIAVNDIDEAAPRFEQAFGWKRDGEPTEQTGLGIRYQLMRAGNIGVELIQPLPGEPTLRRFLDTRGEGIYRLAFATDDMDQALEHLAANDVRFADVSGPAGRETGNRIVFTHPKSTHGVMVEFVEGHA